MTKGGIERESQSRSSDELFDAPAGIGQNRRAQQKRVDKQGVGGVIACQRSHSNWCDGLQQ